MPHGLIKLWYWQVKTIIPDATWPYKALILTGKNHGKAYIRIWRYRCDVDVNIARFIMWYLPLIFTLWRRLIYKVNIWSGRIRLLCAAQSLGSTCMYVRYYSETCLQGWLKYPREIVPRWQVSLHDRCPYMTGVPTWQVSLHDRCPYMTSVLTSQVSLHDRCPYMTGVLTWQVSLHDRCPYMTGVPTWQVSLHDKCPYIAGSSTWGRLALFWGSVPGL